MTVVSRVKLPTRYATPTDRPLWQATGGLEVKATRMIEK